MHLRHCRGAAPALTRPRTHDVAALTHAVRSFHISAPRGDESSSPGGNSSNEPAPLGSARARSQAAGARIQNLRFNPNNSNAGNYKQVGLAGGSFPSGQNASRRVISPVRRTADGSSSSPAGPRLQTPRVQTRVTGGPNQRFPNARPGGPGGAHRPGGQFNRPGFGGARGGPAKRKGGNRNARGSRKKDDGRDSTVGLSDTVLRYLLSLKAARRAVKTHTPRAPAKDDLVAHAALTATLGQPSGAVALLAQRLRGLADRVADPGEPEPVLATARRLVRGQFVQFASPRERDAVLAAVADHQAATAARLSEKKGEEIAPRAIEFAPLAPEVRDATTAAVVAGRYAVRGGSAPPPADGIGTPESSTEAAVRLLDLNGSYVGGDKGKFLDRLNAVLSVGGIAAAGSSSSGKQQAKVNA
ncbi:hypothetical protein SLS56_002389 [Neofusicoccum ribis]|uniref:Uncharacterized protein n=1 Tax=Neofusicoccum ribis TaxID=45134 RepID=A0ABR3T4C1_9PEZI